MNNIIKRMTWKKALCFTGIFAVFYVLINHTAVGVAGLLQITNGANILDFEFGYSAFEAHNMLTALGEQGRSFYLTRIIPIDFPFPFAYMLCYAGWIAFLIKNTVPNSKANYLLAIPVLTMLCDWIENIGIIAMLRNYPSLPSWAVTTASVSGILKTIFNVSIIAIILILAVIFVIRRKRKA